MTMSCPCKVENCFFFNGSEFLERNTIEPKLWQNLNNEQKNEVLPPGNKATADFIIINV